MFQCQYRRQEERFEHLLLQSTEFHEVGFSAGCVEVRLIRVGTPGQHHSTSTCRRLGLSTSEFWSRVGNPAGRSWRRRSRSDGLVSGLMLRVSD